MFDKSQIAAAVLTLLLATVGCSPTSPTAQPPPPVIAPVPTPIASSFVLRGTVRDTALVPLVGVLVQAWSGPEAYTVSDAKGEFTFTGDFAASDVFVALKDGYVTQRRTVESGLDFVLEPVATTTAQSAGQR